MRRVLLLIALVVLTAVSAPARAATPGALDAVFGTFIGPTAYYGAPNLPAKGVVDDQGRTVVTYSSDRFAPDLVVTRLTAGGQLDTTFDAAGPMPGSKRLDFSGDFPTVTSSQRGAVALLPDGRILVVATVGRLGFGDERIALARLAADGAYDPSFGGGDGRVVVTPPSGIRPYLSAIAIDGAGRIVLAGGRYLAIDYAPLLARLSADGVPDVTFDGDGYVEPGGAFGSRFYDLLLDGDRILVAGRYDDDAVVARFDAAGAPDLSFGSGGQTLAPLGRDDAAFEHAELFGLARDDAGRLFAGGVISDYTTTRGVVARFGATGTLDTAWGGAVAALSDIRDVALSSGDRVILAGTTIAGHAALLRLTAADAAPDASFGTGGLATAPTGDRSYGLGVLPDPARTRLLLLGARTVSGDSDRLTAQSYADGLPAPPVPPWPIDPPAGPTPTPPATAAPVAPKPAPAPTPVKATAANSIAWPSTKRCVSRRAFTIRLKVPKGADVTEAIIEVNGKRVATRKGTKLRAAVDLRGLPKGKVTVTIELRRKTGKPITSKRVYKTCATKNTKKQ